MKRKKANMEQGGKPGTPVPGYSPELGTRIAEAIESVGGLRIAANLIGVSEDSLAQWRDGKARPSFFGLQQLAKEAGRSMDWLATGEEANNNVPLAPTSASQIDQELLGRCSDAFARLYKELGISLSPLELGRVAGETYNTMSAVGADKMSTEMQLVALSALVESRRREIQAEAAANKQGKHSA